MALSDRIAGLRERLKERERKREQKQLQKELKKSRRRKKLQQAKERARKVARSKAAPARIEAKAAKKELRQTREEVSANAIPGGQAAKQAGQVASSAASKAAAASKAGASAAAQRLGEAEVEAAADGREMGMFERAGETARAGPVVETAALSPAGNPRRFEALGQSRARRPEESMAGFVTGTSDPNTGEDSLLTLEDGDEGDTADPLAFESGLLGGDGDDNGGLL